MRGGFYSESQEREQLLALEHERAEREVERAKRKAEKRAKKLKKGVDKPS